MELRSNYKNRKQISILLQIDTELCSKEHLIKQTLI